MNVYKTVSILILVVASTIILSNPIDAKFTKESRLTHTFNADTLNQHEMLVSILGNYRIGLLENFQVGTNVFLDVTNVPNLNFKLQLVQTDKYLLSIDTHVFYLLKGFSDDINYQEDKVLYSPIILNNTYRIKIFSQESNINFGMIDNYIKRKLSNKDEADPMYSKTRLHVLGVYGGIDWILNEKNAFTFIAILPIRSYEKGDSSYSTIAGSWNYLEKDTLLPLFLSYNASSSKSFNIELGAIKFYTFKTDKENDDLNKLVPYVNLYWRF